MFTIKIETDNAAFEGSGCGRELSRILARLAAEIKDADTRADSGKLRDINGNTVGSWELGS